MSDDSDSHEKDEELEALLKKLVPSPLHYDLLGELNRDRERLAEAIEPVPERLVWRRLIPLSLLSAVAMAGFAYAQFGERLAGTNVPVKGTVVATTATADTGAVASPPVTVPAATGTTGANSFVPVSAHGYLLNTSSGGIVQTEEGPRQRLNLEYEDAYHWHDPASGTNIRFFHPRSEEVIVPLQTD